MPRLLEVSPDHDQGRGLRLQSITRQPELMLLLSLLVVILAYPALDHGDFRRLILGGLMFVPVLLATIRLAKIKRWVWPSVFLMLCILIFTLANMFVFHKTLAGIKWGLLTVFFALTVVGLFSHLKNARVITNSHLYVAVSIYLLLAMQWFSLYRAIEVFYPRSISHEGGTMNQEAELLYFSLVTLTTIGYGDVVSSRWRGPHVGGIGGRGRRFVYCDHGGSRSECLQAGKQFALNWRGLTSTNREVRQHGNYIAQSALAIPAGFHEPSPGGKIEGGFCFGH